MLQQPVDGIGPLFVDPGGDGVLQVLPLRVHEGFGEAAVHGHRLEEQPPHQIQHIGKQRCTPGVAVLQEVGVEAHGLDLALLPHQGAGAGPVERVQPPGDSLHIRIAAAAPEQHRGQQRIGRGVGPRQRPQQIEAEAAGLEPVGLDILEPDTGF